MPRLPAISPLPPLQQVIPPCRRLPRSSPRSSAGTAHRRRIAFIGLGRFLLPYRPRGASATELSAQAPSGLLGLAGFASDGNAKTLTSPLCMFMAELGVQAPSGLLGPAGFAADGSAEIFTSQMLAFGTRLGTQAPSGLKAASLRTATPRSSPPRWHAQDRARRTGAGWPLRPGRHLRGRQRRGLHLPAARTQDRAHHGGAEWPLRLRRLRRGRQRRVLHLRLCALRA